MIANVENVKELIRDTLSNIPQKAPDNVIESVLQVLAPGPADERQEGALTTSFGLSPTPDGTENLQVTIDLAAAQDANAIIEAVLSDGPLLARLLRTVAFWSIHYGHREQDDAYCLFFVYKPSPV